MHEPIEWNVIEAFLAQTCSSRCLDDEQDRIEVSMALAKWLNSRDRNDWSKPPRHHPKNA